MLKVEQPLPGRAYLGCDTSQCIASADDAQALLSEGFRFIVRYLPLSGMSAGVRSLSTDEAALLTDAGLAVMAVQYGRLRDISSDTGLADGEVAALALRAVLSPQVTLWCDMEDVLATPPQPGALWIGTERPVALQPKTRQQWLEYATAWCTGAAKMGAVNLGMYVGAGLPFTSEDLYSLPFRAYWRSCSQVPNVAHRGYQVLQLNRPNIMVGRVTVDIDVIQQDYQGDRPYWAVKG